MHSQKRKLTYEVIQSTGEFMPIPDYQSLMLPVLRFANDGNEHTLSEIRTQIAQELKLSGEEQAEKLPSGGQTILTNRVSWAAIYLSKAGALNRTKKGIYQITDRGRELLSKYPSGVNVKVLTQYAEFQEFKSGAGSESTAASGSGSAIITPDEQLALSY